MIGTRCRVSFLQYLPKKLIRFGIKVFVNAEAKSGYVLTFQVYTGKRKVNPKLSVSHRVVKELLQSYLGKATGFLQIIIILVWSFMKIYLETTHMLLVLFELTEKIFLVC